MNRKRVGVLTGGGDCPGLNPAIRGLIRGLPSTGYEVVGFRKGWHGIISNVTQAIDPAMVDDLLTRGGTFLGSSRTNPYNEDGGPTKVKENFEKNNLSALVAIGGEDTLGVAAKLYKEGLPVIGIPKTIDNDLDVTDLTLGFMTAVEIATEAMDRLRTTAESHDRVMVVEIMGRHAGWLTAYSGIAGGADMILVPEFPTSITDVIATLKKNRDRGKNHSIIAIAEGAEVLDEDGQSLRSQSKQAVDSFGHVALGGIGELLKDMLKKRTGCDVRATNLGHTQRGGAPSAMDRILSTALGVKAAELVTKNTFGQMPALAHGRIETVPLEQAVGKLKTLTPEFFELAKTFFG